MWEALEHAGWVSTLATSRWIYGLVSVIHHSAVLFSIGTMVLLDLRILGGTTRSQAVSALAEQLRPWAWIGFGSAVISGFLLFASQAAAYVAATPFLVKMFIMVLAVIASLAVEWSHSKFLALISIVLWLGALLAAVEISELTGLG
jgi:hypothetical protein